MKKLDVSRLERLRKMNLKIGYAVALFFMILAFSWETEKPIFKDPFEELPMDDVLIIPPTTQEQAKELPPPDLPEKKIIENNIIIESNKPALLSTELVPEKPVFTDDNVVFGEPTPQPTIESPPPPKQGDDIPPIFKIVEDMPLFGNCNNDLFSKEEKKKCSDSELLTFLYKNIRYPAIARENGVEGLVVVQFIVEIDGSITAVKLLRDIGAGCGQEALRVVNEMPKWTPGKQRGREVRVQYNLPVKYALN